MPLYEATQPLLQQYTKMSKFMQERVRRTIEAWEQHGNDAISEILFRKRWRGEIIRGPKQRLNRRRSEKWSTEDRVICYAEPLFNFLQSKYLDEINSSFVSKSLKLPQTFRISLPVCELFRLPSGHVPQSSEQLNKPEEDDVQQPSK